MKRRQPNKGSKDLIKKSLPKSKFPDWIGLDFDVNQNEPPSGMPSPEEVIDFLEHMPIIQDQAFALKLTEKLKLILFFYQKNDTISRFERGKLMKEREKNAKKIQEWDAQSSKLERKVELGMEEVKRQEDELNKLREAIKKSVRKHLKYENLLTASQLESGRSLVTKRRKSALGGSGGSANADEQKEHLQQRGCADQVEYFEVDGQTD